MTPPTKLSRHRFSRGLRDEQGREYLTDRPVFGYRDLPDNVPHVVQEGDTLWGLAARYFAGVEGAALLWWVVADFQPEPISDPTLALVPGEVVVVPSVATLLTRILVEGRKQLPEEAP